MSEATGAVQTTMVSSKFEDDLVHLKCGCPALVAVCGYDLTDAHENNDPDVEVCAMCDDLLDERCGVCGE